VFGAPAEATAEPAQVALDLVAEADGFAGLELCRSGL